MMCTNSKTINKRTCLLSRFLSSKVIVRGVKTGFEECLTKKSIEKCSKIFPEVVASINNKPRETGTQGKEIPVTPVKTHREAIEAHSETTSQRSAFMKYAQSNNSNNPNREPWSGQKRNICTSAEMRQALKELNGDLVQIDEPTKPKIHNKYAFFDFQTGILNIYTKCKKFWDSSKQDFVETQVVAGAPINDNCCKTNPGKNDPGLTTQNSYPIIANTKEIPDEKLTTFSIPEVVQSKKMMEFANEDPQKAKELGKEAKKIVKSGLSRPDCVEMFGLVIDEELEAKKKKI